MMVSACFNRFGRRAFSRFRPPHSRAWGFRGTTFLVCLRASEAATPAACRCVNQVCSGATNRGPRGAGGRPFLQHATFIRGGELPAHCLGCDLRLDGGTTRPGGRDRQRGGGCPFTSFRLATLAFTSLRGDHPRLSDHGCCCSHLSFFSPPSTLNYLGAGVSLLLAQRLMCWHAS